MWPLPSPMYFSLSQSLIPWVWLLQVSKARPGFPPKQNYFFPTLQASSVSRCLWGASREAEPGLWRCRYRIDINPLNAWPRALCALCHLILLTPSGMHGCGSSGSWSHVLGLTRLTSGRLRIEPGPLHRRANTFNPILHHAPRMVCTPN